MTKELLESMSISSFRETKNIILALFPLFFFIRIIYFHLTAGSASQYGELFKNALVFFVLILSYEYFLNLTFSFSEQKISPVKTLSPSFKEDETPSIIKNTLGIITSIIYYLAQGLFFLSLILMSAIAPIVFLFGTMFSLPSFIKVFFLLLFMGTFWPICFSVFDQVGVILLQKKEESVFYYWSIDFLIEFFKLLFPLTFMKLFLSSSFGSSITQFTGKSVSLLKSLHRSPNNNGLNPTQSFYSEHSQKKSQAFKNTHTFSSLKKENSSLDKSASSQKTPMIKERSMSLSSSSLKKTPKNKNFSHLKKNPSSSLCD